MAFNPELSRQFLNFILRELSMLIQMEDRHYDPREIAAAMMKQVKVSGSDIHGLNGETLESATRRVGMTLSHQHKGKMNSRLLRDRKPDLKSKAIGGCYTYYYQPAKETENA